MFQNSVMRLPLWDLAVNYANGDTGWRQWPPSWMISPGPPDEVGNDAFAKTAYVFLFMLGVPDPSVEQLGLLRGRLRAEHGMFRRVLRWLLSSPKNRSNQNRLFLRYLKSRAAFRPGAQLHADRIVFDRDWGKGNVVGPLCSFLLEECSRKNPKELPVKLCARDRCDRFFLPRRATGIFCSASCRAREHFSKRRNRYWTKKKRAEYMRKHRRDVKALAAGKRRTDARETLKAVPEAV